MATKIDDGGTAFPCTGEGLGTEFAAPGMSLRDYFAAHADVPWGMAHTIAADQLDRTPSVQEVADCQAQMRRAVADSMITALAK